MSSPIGSIVDWFLLQSWDWPFGFYFSRNLEESINKQDRHLTYLQVNQFEMPSNPTQISSLRGGEELGFKYEIWYGDMYEFWSIPTSNMMYARSQKYTNMVIDEHEIQTFEVVFVVFLLLLLLSFDFLVPTSAHPLLYFGTSGLSK